MANGDDANDARLAVDGVHDPKAADTVFPQPVEFAQERLPTLGGCGNGTNGGLDGTFQVGMKRSDHLRHVRRDVGPEWIHALRRFLMFFTFFTFFIFFICFTGETGSPKTSSKVSPFPPDP